GRRPDLWQRPYRRRRCQVIPQEDLSVPLEHQPVAESWRWYNEIADRYYDTFPHVELQGRQLVDYAGPAPGTRLLDVGAGLGAVVRPALARGCVITAVDAAPRMVERLASDLPAVTVRRMDTECL